MHESAGTLLYRMDRGRVEVLLVHPSGPYNRKAPWSIPKGLIDPGEDPAATARRETLEETGIQAGDLVPLGTVQYRKSRKRIHCFAGPAPQGVQPRCASWEVDQAAFLPLADARQRLHPDQQAFLDRLEELLAQRASS